MTVNMAQRLYNKLKNAEYARNYFREAIHFDLAEQVIKARLRTGISQVELSERVGTSQSAIARIERSKGNPSLKTIQRVFEAMDHVLHIESVTRKDHIERQFKPNSYKIEPKKHGDKLCIALFSGNTTDKSPHKPAKYDMTKELNWGAEGNKSGNLATHKNWTNEML